PPQAGSLRGNVEGLEGQESWLCEWTGTRPPPRFRQTGARHRPRLPAGPLWYEHTTQEYPSRPKETAARIAAGHAERISALRPRWNVSSVSPSLEPVMSLQRRGRCGRGGASVVAPQAEFADCHA